MNSIEALLLGALQGVTEFLPVSSSGHLILGQHLLGLKDLHHYIIFDLVCHVGTLFAVFIVFWKQIKEAFQNRITFTQVVLGTLPLFPLVLLLKPIKNLFNEPQYLGYFFLITAGLLYAGIRLGRTTAQTAPYKKALGVGTFQALAILPGVSRSGATISAARMLGWSPEQAVTFSFLLSIPAILGGITLEVLQLFVKEHDPIASLSYTTYAIGLVSSALIGWLALRLLIRIAVKDKFMIFVWYCAALGIITLLYLR